MENPVCTAVPAAHRARRPAIALLAAVLAVGVVTRSARAAPDTDDAATLVEPGQRRFGFGPSVGFLAGNGVTMGGGGGFLRGWFTGGFMPIVVFANARTPDKAVRVNYYNSFQVNEDLAFRIFQRPRLDGSLLVGYKYNTVFGSGGGAGLGIMYDLTRRVGLQISVGLAVFPSAKDRLVHNQGYPSDRTPALTPAIQGGGNIGLVFFP
jgi:hypothetical protein